MDDDANNINSDNKVQIEEVETLKKQLVEMETNWKRALADYKNFEKRTIEERGELILFGVSLFAMKLLSVLDSLEMLETHLNDVGLNLTIKEFKQILKSEGITEIEVFGKTFDPNNMEAIEVVEGEKDKVMCVLQKGYLFKDKLLRPTRVKVGKGDNA